MNKRIILPLLAALLLTGCAKETAEERTAETVQAVETPTEPATETPTEPATETPTEPPTERRRPDIPLLAEIAAMTEEEALEVLTPYTWNDLTEAWGECIWSYALSAIDTNAGWAVGDVDVALEFGGDGYARSVTFYDNTPFQKEREERATLERQLTPIVESERMADDMIRKIMEGDWACEIHKVFISSQYGSPHGGRLRGLSPQTVYVDYTGSDGRLRQLAIEVPLWEGPFSEEIITCEEELPAEGKTTELNIEEIPKTLKMSRDCVQDADKTVIDGGTICYLVLSDMNEDDKREVVALLRKTDGTVFVAVYDAVSGETRTYLPEQGSEYILGVSEEYGGVSLYPISGTAEKLLLEEAMGYVE